MMKMTMKTGIDHNREQVNIPLVRWTTRDMATTNGETTVMACSMSHHTRISKANLTNLTGTRTTICGEVESMCF